MIVRRIGVFSAGKLLAALYAALGLVAGLFVSLASLVGTESGMGGQHGAAPMGALFGVGAIVLLPLVYGVIGFLGGVIFAFLYNVAASVVGGIELDVE